MDNNDSAFNKMVSEAMKEVVNKGWQDANPNAVTLAASGMLGKLIKNRMHSFTKPFYWAAGAIGVAVITYIIDVIIGIR